MFWKILAAVAGLLLLCSCGATSLSGVESLLVSPKLNKRQSEVSQALESMLSLRSIVYKYPRSGEYRTPFIFFDLNGDNREEAIVFYSYSNDETGTVRAKILVQNSDDIWAPFYDIPSQSSGVEFVHFEKLLDMQSYCMIIGWRGSGRQSSVLQINSMRNGVFQSEINASYLNYTIYDYNGDGLAEIVIITSDGARGGIAANLLRGRGGRVETIQTQALSSDAESVLALTSGRIDGAGAVYIDELLSGGSGVTIATEIIRVSSDGLTLLCGGDETPRDGPANPARSAYELTFRDEDIFCMDYNGDGAVEIPYPVSLPGPFENPGLEPPKLIRLMRLSDGDFNIIDSVVINRESGYLLYFPDRWEGKVTVERARESSEWLFRKWNPDTLESAEELLRIRVSATRDYLDMFEGDYSELASKGAISYSAYIPDIPGDNLAVTEQEVKLMFRLLPA